MRHRPCKESWPVLKQKAWGIVGMVRHVMTLILELASERLKKGGGGGFSLISFRTDKEFHHCFLSLISNQVRLISLHLAYS